MKDGHEDIRLAIGGDSSARARFVERHAISLHAMANAFGLEGARADEAVERVFRIAFALRPQELPGDVDRWLLACVRQVAMEMGPAVDAGGWGQPRAGQEVTRALATLSEGQRLAVELRCRAGLRYHDIGIILGLTESAVASLLADAMGRLTSLLASELSRRTGKR